MKCVAPECIQTNYKIIVVQHAVKFILTVCNSRAYYPTRNAGSHRSIYSLIVIQELTISQGMLALTDVYSLIVTAEPTIPQEMLALTEVYSLIVIAEPTIPQASKRTPLKRHEETEK